MEYDCGEVVSAISTTRCEEMVGIFSPIFFPLLLGLFNLCTRLYPKQYQVVSKLSTSVNKTAVDPFRLLSFIVQHISIMDNSVWEFPRVQSCTGIHSIHSVMESG